MKQILLIIKSYITLGYKIYWLNRIYSNRLFAELQQLPNIEKDCLSKDLKKRIVSYTAQCFITASWTSAQRGSHLTEEEKKNIIYLGAITPILDDLTDTLKLTSTEIFYMLRNKKVEERYELIIARYLYDQLLNMSNDFFNETFKETLLSQDASIQQLEKKTLCENTLKKIAQDKGGTASLLFRSVLAPPIKKNEEEAQMIIGYLLQQINDMFDIYKDYINKQQTLFTNSKDMNINYHDFQLCLSKFVSQMNKLDYEKRDIEKCLIEISVIIGRGMVCLKQLVKLQNDKTEFEISKYSREQLICDMEKPKNILKSFACSVHFYNQLVAAH